MLYILTFLACVAPAACYPIAMERVYPSPFYSKGEACTEMAKFVTLIFKGSVVVISCEVKNKGEKV